MLKELPAGYNVYFLEVTKLPATSPETDTLHSNLNEQGSSQMQRLFQLLGLGPTSAWFHDQPRAGFSCGLYMLLLDPEVKPHSALSIPRYKLVFTVDHD